MRSTVAALCLLGFSFGTDPAAAADCPGKPGALGVSRSIVVDPAEHARLGAFQYSETLPLADREVVLTFDDGPLPPYSTRILDILASECVKATFFMVGRMARAYPSLVHRVYDEGHTVANHSQNHPFTFHTMPVDQAAREIEGGFRSLRTVLGDAKAVAPFFRFPGLLRQASVERYLASHRYMTWSVDFMADDWRHIRAHEIVRRAIRRIKARGRGILLLHDIQPATALALPELLQEIKARGFRIVHVVPATASRPKTATEPELWAAHRRPPQEDGWPSIQTAGLDGVEPALSAPSPRSLGVADAAGVVRVAVAPYLDHPPTATGQVPLPPIALWPRRVIHLALPETEALPAPGAEYFKYSGTLRPLIRTSAARKSGTWKFATHGRRNATPSVTAAVGHTLSIGDRPDARARRAGQKPQIESPSLLERLVLRLSKAAQVP